jgi:hypothetical protein
MTAAAIRKVLVPIAMGALTGALTAALAVVAEAGRR